MRYNFLIVGAGAVGCAIARELSTQGSTLVLETHPGPGYLTSRFNSGVIHSGIHLKPEFLKARFAREGGAKVIDFCRKNGVDQRNVGMHIVIGRGDLLRGMGELKPFLKLVRRAKRQNIPMRVRTGQTVRQTESAVSCLLGIHVPGVHIIDPVAYTHALARDAETNGTTFCFNETVDRIEPHGSGVRVWTSSGHHDCDLVVNAAGTYADQVARVAGYEYHQFFYRGEYYQIRTRSEIRASGLVYPVPPKGAKGLGIHMTPTTGGTILLGPNVKRVNGPDDYKTDRTPAAVFHRAVVPFLPNLRIEDLQWSFSGIRAKLSDESTENDFLIKREFGSVPMINLIGIESPGLTSSIAIGEYVRELICPA